MRLLLLLLSSVGLVLAVHRAAAGGGAARAFTGAFETDPVARAAAGPALLLAERAGPGGRETVVLLDPSAPQAPLSESALRRARRLVVDLIDDEVPWNALEAASELRAMGPAAVPALREALGTVDDQQRMFLVSLLLELGVEIDGDLLHAAYRNLGDDDSRLLELDDDTQATKLLISSGAAAWDRVRPGLFARDPQQRFLSAVVLAHTRCPRHVALTVTVLAGHLRDNDWGNDAAQACRALLALGEPAIPHLERLRAMPGPQARQLVALVLEELHDPSPDARAAYQRAKRMAPGRDGRPIVYLRHRPAAPFGLAR